MITKYACFDFWLIKNAYKHYFNMVRPSLTDTPNSEHFFGGTNYKLNPQYLHF